MFIPVVVDDNVTGVAAGLDGALRPPPSPRVNKQQQPAAKPYSPVHRGSFLVPAWNNTP